MKEIALKKIAKMTLKVGEKSVGKCFLWYCQPVVPKKLQNTNKK